MDNWLFVYNKSKTTIIIMEKDNFYVKHIMEKAYPCLGHNFPTMDDWKELIKQRQYITTDQLFILLSYINMFFKKC